jgi:Xaa-Pro aminopeptidase
MIAREKVEALRSLMRKRKVAAYLVPNTDAHQSEYVPSCWRRRPWLSHFTGSAGDVVVTLDEAGLWTDGRYFLQAEEELRGSGIKLFRMGDPGVPAIEEFLASRLKRGDILGADPQVVSLHRCASLEKALAPQGARLKLIGKNLVDLIWKDRPKPSLEPIRVLPTKYAGETVPSKLRRLRKAMEERSVDAHLLTTLDAVAWLCNIRGRDVEFNPVVVAYALVTGKEATLFTRLEKVSLETMKKLGPDVAVRPYGEISNALGRLGAAKARVWIDGETVNRWAVDLLKGADLVTDRSPVAMMKSRKNAAEIEGMRACHVRDGVAVVRFLKWLEDRLRRGKNGGITEISAADRLEEFRAEGDLYQGLSFRTISGYGAHGAIIHYSVSPESDVPLKHEGIYLVDSGGQYLDGTTDITRTVLLGKKVTKEQKDRFTRVLQGHIALARAKFPNGVSGIRLDTLARVPLWNRGLDYNHGTGHGVGSYLNVHEGPQSINPKKDTGAPLEAGNVLSNEPGYYEPGAYGFRIESLVLVVEEKGLSRNGRPFLRFETLTMCPIDRRLIDVTLLDERESAWVDAYHKTVFRSLSPRLGPDDRAWLKRACAPLGAR